MDTVACLNKIHVSTEKASKITGIFVLVLCHDILSSPPGHADERPWCTPTLRANLWALIKKLFTASDGILVHPRPLVRTCKNICFCYDIAIHVHVFRVSNILQSAILEQKNCINTVPRPQRSRFTCHFNRLQSRGSSSFIGTRLTN